MLSAVPWVISIHSMGNDMDASTHGPAQRFHHCHSDHLLLPVTISYFTGCTSSTVGNIFSTKISTIVDMWWQAWITQKRQDAPCYTAKSFSFFFVFLIVHCCEIPVNSHLRHIIVLSLCIQGRSERHCYFWTAWKLRIYLEFLSQSSQSRNWSNISTNKFQSEIKPFLLWARSCWF